MVGRFSRAWRFHIMGIAVLWGVEVAWQALLSGLRSTLWEYRQNTQCAHVGVGGQPRIARHIRQPEAYCRLAGEILDRFGEGDPARMLGHEALSRRMKPDGRLDGGVGEAFAVIVLALRDHPMLLERARKHGGHLIGSYNAQRRWLA